MLVVTVLLAALHNGYWIRSGDGEAYLGIARELWLGRGYRFNGNPVGLVPPLWPGVLAAAMHLSDAFWFLKLIPLVSVIGGLACWFWILTRLSDSAVAATIVITLAILGQVFPLAITFHSDGAFFLLTAAATLVAVSLSQRATTVRIAGLCALCAACVGIRWNGVPTWSHPAAIIATGDRRPMLNRRWLAIIVSGAVTLAAFVALRKGMKVPESAIDHRFDTLLATSYDMLNVPPAWTDYLDRAMNLGRWPATCLYQGLNLVRPLRYATLVAGWGIVGVLVWRSWRGWPRREWLWPSMLAHLAFLAIVWPNAVPRYVLPIAPLFVLAMLLTVDELFRSPRLRTLATAGVVASLWLANAPLYALELWVQRSGDRVSERVYAGFYADLAAVADAIRSDPASGEIAVTRLMYGRGGRPVFTSGHMRALNFLIDRPVMMPPDELCGDLDPQDPDANLTLPGSPSVELHRWCRSLGVTHFVDLTLTRQFAHLPTAGDPNANRWPLYRVTESGFERIETDLRHPLPSRVPRRD